MNFLAHIYLSFDDEELLIGNFIADFIKGKKMEEYNNKIKTGILLHRFIDNYTDKHAAFLKSKKLLSEYRHYASVILDVFYDHFLVKNWGSFSNAPFQSFTKSKYRELKNNKMYMPQNAQEFLVLMEKYDWLSAYGTIEGIDDVLKRMSTRTRFDSKMEKSAENLVKHYEDFNEHFMEFFPQLKAATSTHLSVIQNAC